MKYSAVIVAAGSGTRMKLGYNKVYARIQGNDTILEKTMAAFLNDSDCEQLVIVTDPDTFQKEVSSRIPGRIVLAKGGATRQESVASGLGAVMSRYVMIHDGARPYVSQTLLDSLKKELENSDAVIPGVPCKDTIKVIKDGYIEKTIPRNTLAAAQTPQAFKTDLILTCMHKAMIDGYTGTDDAELVEKYSSTKIKVIEGSYENIKITTPEDLK